MATKKKTAKKLIDKPIRVHKVRASLDVPELTKAGTSLQLEIFNVEGKLGTLVIGRGSLTWYARSKKHGKTKTWSAFADWMATK